MNNIILKLYSKIFGLNKKYNRKRVVNQGAFVKKCSFIISGENNKIIFQEGCRLEQNIFYINGSNNTIIIGKNSRFIQSKFWMEGNRNQILIGDNNKCSGKVILASMEGTSIIVENNNLFSYDIELRTSDGHSIIDETGRRLNTSKSIHIGNNNWISKNVTLLKGASIGDNNIVGYGSLLTKEYNNDHCIIAGVPAKIIKTNIDWRYDFIDECSTKTIG